MSMTRKRFLALAGSSAAVLAGCAKQKQPTVTEDGEQIPADMDLNEFESLSLNAGSWQYDEENNIYYQIGLKYCTKPAASSYESLAIFVPGGYFKAEKNGDTYTCSIDKNAVVGNFTAATAPVLMPINSAQLTPQASPTAYSATGLLPYMQAGCIYVYAGFRGRSAGYDSASASGSKDLFAGGAPWPLVDLKAAIRYLRYNNEKIPFNADRIFMYGFDMGAGLAALVGTSGDAPVYDDYLKKIGAATHTAKGKTLSDAIMGVCSWCPNTSFTHADAAYEWSAGQFSTDGARAAGTWTQQLGFDLADAYGAYVNGMDFRNSNGEQLKLDQTTIGHYGNGSYADALRASLETAASYFAANTTFPYTYTPQRLDAPSFPGDPNLAVSRAAVSSLSVTKPADGSTIQQGTTTSSAQTTTQAPSPSVVQSTVYNSLESYLAAQNTNTTWLTVSHTSGAVNISSLDEFTKVFRPASATVGHCDQLDRGSVVNQLFGIGEESTMHFSTDIAALIEKNQQLYAGLQNWDAKYASDWKSDLEKTDSLDVTMQDRVRMMDPLYFLSGTEEGYGTAKVAAKWRINEGAFNADTSLCTSANLALALSHTQGVTNLDYTLVWGQGHVLAELSGTAAGNMLAWVIASLA